MIPEELAQNIASEKAFFAYAFQNNEKLSDLELDRFRRETIIQRRERLSQQLYEKMHGSVAHGPFKGLTLDATPFWGRADIASMLLGCYELEVIEALHSQEFLSKSHFVDIGAADGYYVVGGLKSGRFKTADCFELTESGRGAILKNAQRNGVADRLRIFEKADRYFPAILADIDWGNTVVLCDIEGAELELFDDNCLSAMSGAMILIEIHNWVENFWQRYEALLERIFKKYKVRFLERSRLPAYSLPELRGMHDDNRMLILSEGRPNVMRFLQLVSLG